MMKRVSRSIRTGTVRGRALLGNRYAYGPVVEARRHLVVSGGLGCSIAPVRLGVPPEITVVDLSRPPAAAT
jgi:predicted MPP superfamily phosphohydrolase